MNLKRVELESRPSVEPNPNTNLINPRRVAARFLVAIGLIVLPIRDFLFGDGLYIYRDWSWPLSTQLTPRAAFSPSTLTYAGPDPFGFTRMFLTWPIFLIDQFTTNIIIAEKLFVIYLLSIIVVLSFILATRLLRLLNSCYAHPLTSWRAEAFILFVMIFSFANFWSLEQMSDMYYTYLVEFMLFGISLAVVLLRDADLKSIGIAGVALSFCVMLDPDLYLFGLLTISLAIFLRSFARKATLRLAELTITRILTLIAVTLPALLTVVYAVSQSSGTNLRSLDTGAQNSNNLSLMSAVRLFGYLWSVLTYAPPSIIGSESLSQIPAVGSPPYLLLPDGLLTTFWLCTTWFVPVFAFSTILVRRTRKISGIAAIVAVVGLAMTQSLVFPIYRILATALSWFPDATGAISTVFAIPDHILIMVAVSYLILVAIGVYLLLRVDFAERPQAFPLCKGFTSELLTKRLSRSNVARSLIIGTALVLLIFPSWQLFSGSFFPASYVPGLAGNGIPSVGAFTPAQPPRNMIDVYDWFLSQPGNFNVYWPGPAGATYPWSQKSTPGITWIDSPRPTFLTSSNIPGMFPTALQYLLTSNLTGSIAQYLAALNVRYLVLQPYDPTGLAYSWGVSNYATLKTIISHSAGISLAKSDGDISVFSVSDPWGPLYSPNLVLNYDGGDQTYATAYGVLASLGTRVAIARPGSSNYDLCYDSLGCTISILSPAYLANYSPNRSTFPALFGDDSAPSVFSIDPSRNQPLPAPDSSWILSNWGDNSVGVDLNDSMRWNFSGTSVVTLSYNGTVTNGHPGGIHVPIGYNPIVQVGFSYRTSSDSDLSLQVLMPILNASEITSSIPESVRLAAKGDWTHARYDLVLPSDAAFFTSRIQAVGSKGWIEVKDVTFNVTMAKSDGQAFFGMVLPVQANNPSSLGTFQGNAYVQSEGTGFASGGNTNATIASPTRLEWFEVSSTSETTLMISGNIEIADVVISDLPLSQDWNNAAIMKTADSVMTLFEGPLIYSRMFDLGYAVTDNKGPHSPIPTLDGMNLFVGVGPGNHNVVISTFVQLTIGYLIALVINACILILVFRRRIETIIRSGVNPLTHEKRERL